MATLRNLAISLLYLAGVKEVTRTSRPSHATETASTTSRYETQVSNDFGDPVHASQARLAYTGIRLISPFHGIE